MSDMKNKAKSEMLKELSKTMSDDQNSPLKDIMGKKMQKVTVMSDSKKGLEQGLSKAEQILKKKESMMPEMEESEDEMEDESEAPEMEDSEEESEDNLPQDKESIESMIAMLQKKLENC
jgi:hypothetical protein